MSHHQSLAAKTAGIIRQYFPCFRTIRKSFIVTITKDVNLFMILGENYTLMKKI